MGPPCSEFSIILASDKKLPIEVNPSPMIYATALGGLVQMKLVLANISGIVTDAQGTANPPTRRS
jgi:hypothetical protein